MQGKLSSKQERARIEDRQRARTDLFWLCREILGYDWVNWRVHEDMIETLPHRQGGTDHINEATGGFIGYTPKVLLEELEPDELRNILILFPRGSLKTTIATIADNIQWILNYPGIRIALITAIGEQGVGVHDEIRKHFQFNERLRFLFPELCPPERKAADWGNQEQFTVLNRGRNRKEPTQSLLSVGKVIAGWHFDVLKFSDVVDWTNVQTPGQIIQTIRFANYCEPLIEAYPNGRQGWRIVEGTTYDFGDWYSNIRDKEAEKPEGKKDWKICVRSVKNEDGTLLWPERITEEKLRKIESDDPFIAASQYYMNPIPQGGGLATKDQIIFTEARVIREIMPMLRIHCTIDVHGMDPSSKKSDSTVLNVSGYDRDGRMYGIDIRCGKFTVWEVIEQMFEIQAQYRPIDFKPEKDAHMRVLLPFLQREMNKRQKFMTLNPLQRDNRTSKKQRIKGLQPWFRAGLIRFSDAITCKAELISQIIRFSDTSSYHDDILDTIADQMTNRDGGASYDLIPNASRGTVVPFPVRDSFLGFDPITHQPTWARDRNSGQYDPILGAL